MSKDGQGSKRGRKIAENFNRLSRVYERYRRQTDRQTGDSIANVNLSSRSLKRKQVPFNYRLIRMKLQKLTVIVANCV